MESLSETMKIKYKKQYRNNYALKFNYAQYINIY